MDSRTGINEIAKPPDILGEHFMNFRKYQQNLYKPQIFCSRPIPDVSPRLFPAANNSFTKEKKNPLLGAYENYSAFNQGAQPVSALKDFSVDGEVGGTNWFAGTVGAPIYRRRGAPAQGAQPVIGVLAVGAPLALLRLSQRPPLPQAESPWKNYWETVPLPPAPPLGRTPHWEGDTAHSYPDREGNQEEARSIKQRAPDKKSVPSVHIGESIVTSMTLTGGHTHKPCTMTSSYNRASYNLLFPSATGGLLTLPMDGRNTPRTAKDPAVRQVVLQGCLEVERLVKRYNVCGEPDLRALCKQVAESTGDSGGVMHMEAVMRTLALGFLRLSGSWSALASLVVLPTADRCRSLRALRKTFRRWQDSTRRMLETTVATLNSLPEDYEEYFSKNFESSYEKPTPQRPPKCRYWKRGNPTTTRYPYRQKWPCKRKPHTKFNGAETAGAHRVEKLVGADEDSLEYRDASVGSDSTYWTCPAAEGEQNRNGEGEIGSPTKMEKVLNGVRDEEHLRQFESIGFYGPSAGHLQMQMDSITTAEVLGAIQTWSTSALASSGSQYETYWMEELLMTPLRHIERNLKIRLYNTLGQFLEDMRLLFGKARLESIGVVSLLMIINRTEIEFISLVYSLLLNPVYS